MLFGIALTVEGHWAHGIRMGSIGKPEKHHHQLWELVTEMQDKAGNQLQVGNPLNRCEESMIVHLQDRCDQWGLTDYSQFRNGHGLGQSYEEPRVSDCFPQHFGPASFQRPVPPDVLVETSMVLELHPNIFVPNLGGAAIGGMYVTGPTGPRSLLQFPRKLMSL